MGIVKGLFIVFFVLNIWLIIKTGGVRKNFAFSFALLIYFLYCCLTPLVYYDQGILEIHGNYIGDYYEKGLYIYLISLSCFSLAYFLTRRNIPHHNKESVTYSTTTITVLFILVFGINLLNLSLGGISIAGMFDITNPDAYTVFRPNIGYSNYLSAFADSLIAVLILGYIFKVPKSRLIIWVILTFFYFSLLGFRYRILLAIIGFIIVYYINHRFVYTRFLKFTAISLVALYFMLFISENRRYIYSRQFQSITFPLISSDFTVYEKESNPILYEARNFLTDLSVLKYYEETDVAHDYGQTIFLYPFVRLIPAFFFTDGVKPYPPPTIKVVQDCFGTLAGFYSGSAITNIFEYYISFGIPGCMAFMYLMGFLLGKLQNNFNPNDSMNIAFYIIITISLFQIVSRGIFLSI